MPQVGLAPSLRRALAASHLRAALHGLGPGLTSQLDDGVGLDRLFDARHLEHVRLRVLTLILVTEQQVVVLGIELPVLFQSQSRLVQGLFGPAVAILPVATRVLRAELHLTL